MNYKELYRRKVVSVEEALQEIKSHHEVVCGLAACEPVALLSELHTIKDRVEDVSVVTALLMGKYEFYMNPEMKGHFLLNNWFYTDGPREAHSLGTVSYVPMQLHQFSSKRLAYRKPNVFLGCASPMDKHGYVSLSLSTVMEKDIIENSDLVILETNPNLPRTFGDTHVHISEIDYIVETDRSIPELPAMKIDEKDHIIGSYVADLIEDGSTIQIGLGSIPGAVALSLSHKKDLGVHTEMLTDCILDLYEAGAITNRRKTLWKDKIITGLALGSRRLYDFLDDNMLVEFHRSSVVNDPRVIAKNNKMVSINSALQMDLTGQCCAESVGARQFSGTGGHKEFANGSQESLGGKSILAFHSSTKKDTISRIVPLFEEGTIVTTSRVDVDYIVTEYGVACLRGRSVQERVKELINIAHPNFRDYLRSEAKRKLIW
ncbi:4-hydroxybutyrate coenzyme A transferase [Candidatus Syntrophocurvum alkaliphilum]|uniref:4-hydroxybutyrate coenzyme A transferase n=1 Tax=Candidatus Syntrophocurvum alkaliphilum TaxID=2293317 RepID=A0A6I6DHI4_9FIRM|nr:acetyl-CoA hydrolase/transferase C-terminal domain-containing protein [Candidatus Syntrophocurvum alkaliphilum]QGU00243.1 4-hydroxybutyrate coenzyme A transferase [Candidatus Syntrophocurvum alkaliphilum]